MLSYMPLHTPASSLCLQAAWLEARINHARPLWQMAQDSDAELGSILDAARLVELVSSDDELDVLLAHVRGIAPVERYKRRGALLASHTRAMKKCKRMRARARQRRASSRKLCA